MWYEMGSERLRDKLARNSLRREREELLTIAPSAIADALALAPFYYWGDVDNDVTFHFHESGIGYEDPRRPLDYLYRAFPWDAECLSALRSIPRRHEAANALLWLGRGPLFEVAFGWGRERLGEAWLGVTFERGVVCRDMSAGILMSEYCGYVNEVSTPHENVYELGVWGFGDSHDAGDAPFPGVSSGA
jgi:hypothetical protein